VMQVIVFIQEVFNWFRELNKTPNATYETYQRAVKHIDPEICANAVICLIKIVTYLLHKQIEQLEKAFINEGGLREKMTKARLLQQRRKHQA